MAKTAAKTSTKTTSKAPAKTTAKPKKEATSPAPTADILETASEEALKKLQSLGLDEQLQSDLAWCINSYRFDRNPAGLYEMAGRALTILNAEKAKKTKGVTVKLIGDLEKALKIQ
jgi:hypothetical protein